MQIQIKKTIKAGNSSAVVLPRSWLDKEVRVELIKKTNEQILYDVLEITKKHMKLEEIIGVYLVGSYARGEETSESDIDILVISDNLDKEQIQEGIYSILIVSYQLLHQKLKQDLFPIGQMIKEAKPLLNADYIDGLKVRVTKENVKGYLDTTEDKLKLINRILNKTNQKEYVDNKIIYTLILRIRTLHIIKKLIKNKPYSNKEFIKIIQKISKNAYEVYLDVKSDLNKGNKINVQESGKLIEYLEKELKDVKRFLR